MKNEVIYEKLLELFQERIHGVKDSNEDEQWSFSVYWFTRILYKTGCFLCYVIVLISHWGKGKPVPAIKNDLLLLSATKVAEKIRSGKLTSEEIVNAYIERIKEVNPYINAVAESRFEEAVKEAKECDYLVRSGIYTKEWLEKEKPLLGIPVTIKVLFNVKGCHSTGALTLFKDIVATEDAPAVELLKSSGAIILATTNSSESGLGLDTINIRYGKTLNPYDCNRTPGGSSGGESALISSAGSVIGVGNDLIGSVRIPASFTGLFAHKPSRGLVPNKGCFIQAESVLPYLASGPLCRYAEDLATMMEVLTSKNNERMKFNKPVNFKKLKIYYQTKVHHPMVETLDKEILKSMMTAIHHFVQIYGATAEEVNIKMNLAPNMVHHSLVKSSEPIVFNSTAGKMSEVNVPLEFLKLLFGKSNFSLWILLGFAFLRNPLLYKEENIPFYTKYQNNMYKEFDSMLDENSVFICPTIFFSAPRPYQMIPYLYSAVWSAIFSILGFPVTQVPIGSNRSGMPYGMQIVTAMNNDNLSLTCAKELSKLFGGWIPPS